ncbi:L,D-transpeptidase scaffold domain-containing protein [Mucilaginibacter ginsenosidivorans]|uniref:L,D-transpeptidase family protein n=1 Tax=Mucilaginibacter ginsenosidivorans TaxID=398053 RepID=A0A5B8UT26_9SPHI|nr:L,D-transpeptidase family protein [Mucilaginibacter ginsenosidivorans]QEC62139.1 L,D-transpeptidase family protein [Mucilaginibacter ginsenosidivorans]
MEKLIKHAHGNRANAVIFCTLLLFASIRGFASCNAVSSSKANDADTSVTALIQQYLVPGKEPMLYYPNSVKRFYEANGYQAAWVSRQGDTKQTWEAMMLLDCVLQYGLSHEDYHPKALLYDPLHTMIEEPGKISNSKKARFDILLTDALITFINNLHYGKLNPWYAAEKIDGDMSLPFHAESVLMNARRQPDITNAIVSVQPRSKQYLAMQDRMRLLKGQYQEDCYAVPDSEVHKIAINMERLRWADIGGNGYIQVNIPSYTLKFYQPDTVYEFKVVVGKTSAPTPTLNSEITYFTTSPEWKIPQKIFVNEILPKALKNADYIENSHFAIYDKSGNYITPDRTSLLTVKRNPQLYYARQSSGCDNALGQLVFRFANVYDIYLHDTPEKQLFNREERAFSHSCIRVENAQHLAELMLKRGGDSGKIATLTKAMKNHLTKNISFSNPVSIKITYLTCEVKEGSVYNYKDIYDLDKSLEMALYSAPQTLTMQ